MSDWTIGWHLAMGLIVMAVPLIGCLALGFYVGIQLSNLFQDFIMAMTIMVLCLCLGGIIGVGWVASMSVDCGYLDVHFPIEEEDLARC